MKKPAQFLAHPPNQRRAAKFNATFAIDPAELAEAARQLGMLAPDGQEITWKLKAELRFQRTTESLDKMMVVANFEVAAIEKKR